MVVLMPLFRYLLVAGGGLLALLLIADWSASTATQERQQDRPQESATTEVDRTVIRIHSANKWPAAVTFDTATPIVVAPMPVVVADAGPTNPAGAKPAPLPAANAAAARPASKIAENVADTSARRRTYRSSRMSAHRSVRDFRRRLVTSQDTFQDGFQSGGGWNGSRGGW